METVIQAGDSGGQSENYDVSALDLRAAMGTFLTGVTIVTARCDDGQPYGLTVNSFNSVSLDPPLVLWSLDNHHDKGDLFRNAGGFAVNIMPAGSDALIHKFAVNDADRFVDTQWHWGTSGHPVLDTALTSLECRLWAEYPGGDHSIFVGKVTAINTRDGQPAAYYKGQLSAFTS